MTETTERLDSLEIRIAYQDEIIETLNKAVTEQWMRIEAVTREITRLTDRVRTTRIVSPLSKVKLGPISVCKSLFLN